VKFARGLTAGRLAGDWTPCHVLASDAGAARRGHPVPAVSPACPPLRETLVARGVCGASPGRFPGVWCRWNSRL